MFAVSCFLLPLLTTDVAPEAIVLQAPLTATSMRVMPEHTPTRPTSQQELSVREFRR